MTGSVLRITPSQVFKSNLHMESRPMIINPAPFTVDENLHKIGRLASLWYSEQHVNSLGSMWDCVID